MAADGETAAGRPPHVAASLLFVVRRTHGPSEADLAVVDSQVEAAIRIAAHPRLVRDRRAIPAVVAERKERALATLPAHRELCWIQPVLLYLAMRIRPRRVMETPFEPTLRLASAPPRIVALERLIEAEHIREVEARVGGLADEEPEVDEGENDISEIGG
jgi:hypothetical protein